MTLIERDRNDFSAADARYLLKEYQQRETIGGDEEDRLIGEYVSLSEQARSQFSHYTEYEYISGSAEHTMRVFRALNESRNSPAAIVFRGGYWRIPSKFNGKAWCDFPALGLVPNNITVISVDYPVLSAVSMEQLIYSAKAGVEYIYEQADQIGINADSLHLIGHSAGGQIVTQLAAQNLDTGPYEGIHSITAFSGVYDIGFAASRNSHLRKDSNPINISFRDAARFSPMYSEPNGRPVCRFLVGADEPDEFQWQSNEIAKRWSGLGISCIFESIPNTNHYTLFGGLADPNSFATISVVEQISKSA